MPLDPEHLNPEHVDVLVVGAGLSGICAGYHLQTHSPARTYAILEARAASGGTWDLFRYPGIRSDSDMYTLGYSFRPWTKAKAIADGHAILEYVRETASTYGIDAKIRFNHRVLRASWSTRDARWSVDVERRSSADTTERLQLTCNFLFMCSGYYSYEGGYTPTFRGQEDFAGQLVHAQRWPSDLDYRNQRVVVIGSGATAITLVPELAKHAAHVTMLQRSPSYVVALPGKDRVAAALTSILPRRFVYRITRLKNVLVSLFFYRLSRRSPRLVRNLIATATRNALGPDYDVATHFTPRYEPWDQRLCVTPDGDLFKAIRGRRVTVVTDRVASFSKTGIVLHSGNELPADLIVMATGLNLVVLGGVELHVDGTRVDLSKTLSYKGMMYSDVPNMAWVLGYSNASWTLKASLTCEYVCRLLNYMQRHGLQQCTPRNHDASMQKAPLIDFTSGYVLRNGAAFPRQGTRTPWRLYQNYFRDLMSLRFGSLRDEAMEFSNPRSPT
jgi:monooxygenase